MTGVLGAGANAKQATALGSMQFQTSQVGGVIPLVYGATRVAVNLIDYQDFTAIPVTPKQQKGKGGKGKGGADAKNQGKYTYTATILLGVCQGPVNFGLCWWDKNISPLSGLPGISSINSGADDQGPDPYFETAHPENAIGYSGTANFVCDNYQLGYSGALPNFTVEVLATATAVNQCDGNPSAIITDFLTNSRYGAGFPAANLDTAGTIADYGNYCDAAGIFLAPQLDQQTQAQSALANIAQLTVAAIVWSGGLLKMIPYGDAPLSATYWVIGLTGTTGGGDTITLTFSSPGLGIVAASYQAQPSNVNTDTVDNSSVMGRLAQAVNGTSALTSYGITAGVGIGSTVIRMAGADQSVTVAASVTQVPGSDGAEGFNIYGPFVRSWAPVTTIRASLGDDDFIVQESTVGGAAGVTPGSPALRMGAGPVTGGFTDDPVQVTRSSPADAMNHVQLEVLDRAYGYNAQIVEAFDQGLVDLYGVRKDTGLKARAIVDPAGVGPIVAQLLLQRSIAYRNTYSFKLGWKYCLLEPMDLIEISDSYLGLENNVVRITGIAEDEEGTLRVTAEDYFGASSGGQGSGQANGNTGTAAFYPKQGSAPTTSVTNAAATAPSVSTPFIFEPTAQLLQAQGVAQPQIIIGLAAPGPVWGGCVVYGSMDDESFGSLGTFIGRSTLGVTTTGLGAGATSVTVDFSGSGGTPQSVSPLLAANGVSLCAIRGLAGILELLSFTTATLVSGSVYTLSGLARGLYGTPDYGQAGGAQFMLLGGAQYFQRTLPPHYAGHNLWFKFPSFNIYGGGVQSLAEAAAYLYTPHGVQLNSNQVTARAPIALESTATAAKGPEPVAPIESR
jgi:Putative phage tail protein